MANININEIGYNQVLSAGTANALMVQYKRANAAPMDITEVHTTKKSAEDYARNGSTSYAGQIISEAGENIKTKAYKITSGGTLLELIDEETFDTYKEQVSEEIANVISGGELNLKDYAKLEYVDERDSEILQAAKNYADTITLEIDFTPFYTKEEVDTVVATTKAETINIISGYTNTSIELVKENLQSEIDKAESSIEVIETEIGDINGQITTISSEVTNISNSLSNYATTANLEEHITEFSENVNTVNGELEKFQTSIDSINSNITNIQTSLETINGDISTNKSEIDSWIETHETITSELRNDVDLLIEVDANNRLNTIEGETSEIHTTIDNIESNILSISGITSGFINDVKTSYVSKEFFENREEEILNSGYSYTDTRINGLEDVYEKKGVSETNLNAYKTEVDSLISGTKAWVEGKNYLTTHQDISHLAIKTEVDEDITDAKDEVYTSAVTYTNGKVSDIQSTLESQISNVAGNVESMSANVKTTLTGYVTTGALDTYKGEVTENITEAKDDVYASAVTYTNGKVGTVQTNLNNTNTALSTLSGSVVTLVSGDTNISVRTIASEEVAKIVADANEKYDTLKEIADWIINDTIGAAQMANDITKLKSSATSVNERLDTLDGGIDELSGSVKTYYITSAATINAIGEHVSMVNSQVGILETNVIASANTLSTTINTLSGNIETTINTLSGDLVTSINKKAVITTATTSNKLILLGLQLRNNTEFTGGTILQSSNTPIYMQDGELYSQSDERLKDFADDIIIDFDKLSNIPKRYFKYKNSEEWHIGTSAQAIREVYPEIVNKCDDGTLSVAYDKLSIIALAAIDKLYQENIDLKERLRKIEEKLGL